MSFTDRYVTLNCLKYCFCTSDMVKDQQRHMTLPNIFTYICQTYVVMCYCLDNDILIYCYIYFELSLKTLILLLSIQIKIKYFSVFSKILLEFFCLLISAVLNKQNNIL